QNDLQMLDRGGAVAPVNRAHPIPARPARRLPEGERGMRRDMAAAMCVAGLPLARRKAAGRAGLVPSVGWGDFIRDPSPPHHMRAVGMAPSLGVSEATLMNRARDIREGLGLVRMDPRWSTVVTRLAGWLFSPVCVS